MASAPAAQMTIGIPGVTITIWYDDITLRVEEVEWDISLVGFEVHIRIWNTDINPTIPVLDITRQMAQGSAQFIGDNFMVEEYDPEIGTYLTLPANIFYTFLVYEL